MKNVKRLLGFVIVFMVVMVVFCSVGFAATVGQVLTSPEAGWRRIDDKNINAYYESSWFDISNSAFYGGTIKNSTSKNAKMKFKFYGSKIRLISNFWTNRTDSFIKIDDKIYTFSEYQSTTTPRDQAIVFEYLGLTNQIHTVEIYPDSSKFIDNTHYLSIDAIDIDDIGYLVDYNAPTNLIATASNSKVDIAWTATTTTGTSITYNVKRSTTAGGPYTTIATTSAITYSDTNVLNGTTYYYVVSAVISGIESANSNEVSVTPIAPPNSGILEITMSNGQIKEYDLAATELQSFLTWYDVRSNGTGKAYYTIIKKNNIKPFLSRKEYILYDKISSFEVNEYGE